MLDIPSVLSVRKVGEGLCVGSAHQEGLHTSELWLYWCNVAVLKAVQKILHRHTHSGAIRNLYCGSCLVGKAGVIACRAGVIALQR